MFRSSTDITLRGPKNIEKADDEYYDCDLCTHGGWGSETEVEIHRASIHSAEITRLLSTEKYLCRVCIKKFGTGIELLRHIKKHHLFSSEDALRVERDIFICDYCCQIFFNKDLLCVHIRHFHYKYYISNLKNQNLHHIPCPKCHKKVRLYGIWFHFQTHSIQSTSLCRICLHKCKNRKQLQNHLKIHPKLLHCQMCGYETKRDELFRQHVLTKHRNSVIDNGVLDVQKYFYPRKELLLRYSRFTGLQGLHLTNGVRICIVCREICVGLNKMKNHILVEHSVNKQVVRCEYSCTCGEMFTNKILLKQHTFKLKGDHKSSDTCLTVE